MEYQNLLVQLSGEILNITINRPDKLNALNSATIAELSDALDAAHNQKEARVIVITGAGDAAFVAGADISEFAHFSVEEGKKLSADGHKKLFNKIADSTIPVIAAVNGYALGGGLELAMSAHIRIATTNAKLGLPEVSLGVIPGYGGTQRLTQLVGRGKALEMIMTGGMIKADEALTLGLVNSVVEPEHLMQACLEMAGRILKNSSRAIAGAIRSVNAAFEAGTNGLEVEIDEFGKCFGTDDFKEGTSAFLEKRKPKFTGR